MADDDPQMTFAKFMLDDVSNRTRWQHEFSLAGIRTLVLMNGGAIVALLTYIGRDGSQLSTDRLQASFIAYVVGLVATTIAYLLAYYSQGTALNSTLVQAQFLLGRITDEVDISECRAKVEEAGSRLAD